MNTENKLVGMVASGEEFQFGHKLFKNVNGKYFYLIPKKKPFFQFGSMFNLGTRVGESLNVSSLNIALKHDADLLFIYPLTIFTIPSKEFSEWSEKNNTMRVQNNGNEATKSCPLDIMQMHRRKFDL